MKRNIRAISMAVTYFFFATTSFAQEKIDTIYYDKDWKGVANKSFADFYRIAVYPASKHHKKLCRDYYISGELQGTAGFISIDKFDDSKSVFDGESTTYFKNGKVAYKETWRNEKRNGEFCEYTENGLVVRKGEFSDGELNGLYTEFLENDACIQAEYQKGKPKHNYYIMSNPSGHVLKFRFSDNKPIWETPSVNERKLEYQNGTPYQYYIKNGLIVTLTNTTIREHGKWHRVDIIISNNSMSPIEFDPEKDISAYSLDKKEKDTDLQVWSCDKYMRKVRRAQNWAAASMAFAQGMATAGAGYSTSTINSSSYYSGSSSTYGTASAYGSGGYGYGSYQGNTLYSGSSRSTSTTTTYDAAAAYQAQVLSQNRMMDFTNAQWSIRDAIQRGYLKKNTIYPGETISGYVHIKRIRGKFVYITININGANYLYAWQFGK